MCGYILEYIENVDTYQGRQNMGTDQEPGIDLSSTYYIKCLIFVRPISYAFGNVKALNDNNPATCP